MDGYTLVWAAGKTAPASCSLGTVAYRGALTSYRHENLAPGKYQYRLCARDRLGNLANGVTRGIAIP
jgi:hypothetical protein